MLDSENSQSYSPTSPTSPMWSFDSASLWDGYRYQKKNIILTSWWKCQISKLFQRGHLQCGVYRVGTKWPFKLNRKRGKLWTIGCGPRRLSFRKEAWVITRPLRQLCILWRGVKILEHSWSRRNNCTLVIIFCDHYHNPLSPSRWSWR